MENYEERTCQLESLIDKSPSHSGLGSVASRLASPIGFDSIKAHRTCQRIAERTEHYTNHVVAAAATTYLNGATTSLLKRHLDAGHDCASTARLWRARPRLMADYPWQSFIDQTCLRCAATIPTILSKLVEVIFAEMPLPLKAITLRKRKPHWAWRSYQFVELEALKPATTAMRGLRSPHQKTAPPKRQRPAHPLFAQMGEDAREASAEHGEAGIAAVIEHLVQTIEAFTSIETD